MRIESCDFPDDLLYDADGLTWTREGASGEVTVGVTAVYASLAGRLLSVRSKPVGAEYDRGRVIGTLEGVRYFGPIRSPVRGRLVAVNSTVLARPRRLSESPYEEGWFAHIRPIDWVDDRRWLRLASDAAAVLTSQVAALRVRCFAAVPDYEMFEIGVECAAVLVRLNELLSQIEVGDVVHIVSDDPTAPIEMARWSDETRQPVIEERREGNLFHFLVRKID